MPLALGDPHAVLTAHLLAHDPAPVVVAFSGGGDSLALLLIAKTWADRWGRRLLAITIDHGLRPESAVWALWCRRRAERLGVAHQTLTWVGGKPATGLAAAARSARHDLLADAARAAGARIMLMGHTADDRAEAVLMRQAGSTVPSPRLWGPSPAWPAGRGVFILRPLLHARRAAIRACLAAAGEIWIDDPANSDPASVRARARLALAAIDVPADDDPVLGREPSLAGVAQGPAGDLTMSREALGRAADARALLAAALACASGSSRSIRRESLTRLLDRLAGPQRFAATLAGVRVLCGMAHVRLVRDVADRRGAAAAELELPPNQAAVWDGRIELRAAIEGARVTPLAGHAARLPPALRQAILAAPSAVRPALPLVTHPDGRMACPTVMEAAWIEARPLTLHRLAVARGAVRREADLLATPQWPLAARL